MSNLTSSLKNATYQNPEYDAVPTISHDDNDHVDVIGESPRRSTWKWAVAVSLLVVMAWMGKSSRNTDKDHYDYDYEYDSHGVDGKPYVYEHEEGNKELSQKKWSDWGGRWGKSKKALPEYQTPRYYNDQLVDHESDDTTTWSQRYYVSSQYFQGPGSPLIVVMGGEGPVDEVFYDFVKDTLAEKFGAYVLQTEHRFYGTSIPTEAGTSALPTADEFKRLLTPAQALADFVRITRHIQGEIGCSVDRSSPEYCPVITVGASYPGFLSAMMRFVYPDVVDMSYASSAPLQLYSQEKDQYAYFDKVTQVAEAASPGCAAAYKSSLQELEETLLDMDIKKAAKKMGICHDGIPSYITTPELFANELTMLVGFSNADFNMDYHPPGDPTTDVIMACKIFQQKHKDVLAKMKDYFIDVKMGSTDHPNERPCYDLHWDMPSGHHSRIMGADWSGMGDGDTANTWEFQCCRDLIIQTGFGPESMFLEKPFDLDWLSDHCQARFQVEPQPTKMVDEWRFDDLVGHGGSYILFTNGLNDGWSALSYLEDLSDTIVSLNFPSGAHHSELNTVRKEQKENDDIVEGRIQIGNILERWIADVKSQATN